MATGSVILGKLKGSIGDVTTQSRGSKQVVRRRVREVSNPQTDAQTLNRIITGTVGAAYSRMKEICDHSFQGLSSKAENMDVFLALNQNMLRSRLLDNNAGLSAGNFLAIGKTGFVPNPYIISKGTLAPVSFMYKIASGVNLPVISTPDTVSSAPTYQQLCDWYNLKRGDQVTFVWIEGAEYPSVAYEEDLFGLNNLFGYSRVILDPINPTTGLAAPMSTPLFGDDGKVQMPSPRNAGQSIRLTAQNTNSITFFPEFNNFWGERHCMAFGIIVSRQSGGVWMRSFCKMQVTPAIVNIPSMQQAIDASYPDTSDLLDPTKFLNASPKN